jgi:2-oxoisovalerate dehydrogenase E1 component alpha subunit
MKSAVVSFCVDRTQYLNSEGGLAPVHPAFADDTDELIAMYEAMVLTRTFDAKAVALQRTGRLGTFASSLGQEAVAVGVAAAMRPDDVLVPSFREQGAQLWRGTTAAELLLYWGGDERGSDFAGPREDFPICVPIGTHAPHATGVALAFRLRHEPRAAVCVFGDGATSRGDVYESMNFAGIQRLPVVYVVNDNQWAISVPRAEQSRAQTLAQKAIACGIEGEQVDGNDVIAVRDVVGSAIARAREGWGPTLVEALTYRLADHTTADDASRYRSDDEVTEHWRNDPVARLRALLVHLDVWGREREEELLARCESTIDEAVEAYEATPPMPASAMFDHLHAELPGAYRSQLDEINAREARHG